MTAGSLKSMAWDAVRWNALPVAMIVALIAAGAALGAHHDFHFGFIVFQDFWLLFNVAGFGAILAGAALLELFRSRPARPFAHLRVKFGEWRVLKRAIVALPILLTAPAMFSAFSAVKAGIPVMNPFHLDPLFAEMDRIIHGGDAWTLVRPVLETPAAVFAINIAYHLWFFLFYGALALAAVMVRDVRLRNQFLTAFVLTWIVLGLVVATQMSSVGPVFFADFYPQLADPYAEQMALLRAADEHYPIWALDVQALLLEGARNPAQDSIGRGISAMPSLHVAVSVLMALFTRRVNRWLGLAAWVFAAVIMLGSVVLAWHYAVDGYLSALLTPMVWVLAGWLTRPRRVLAAAPLPQPASA
ncbi:hypothetical protein E4M02_05780 [Brevundimonas sp. S30B]|uniref:phosphatase PAP2 family protein n=1 Tax=unclassified Brevundimonas TaxID=2622653 RepID=UPI001071DEA3|nr:MULTISPECIES: phosphatase PAP2 family protein [unclassified Brevundimonas]QBX36633.1 hypothetical protein E4M01_02035 [Brevundimonas sp. MF30-B]TFW04572.1 hypothetical protein E4M02_05780 [Brevundimonas sp. S30B]